MATRVDESEKYIIGFFSLVIAVIIAIRLVTDALLPSFEGCTLPLLTKGIVEIIAGAGIILLVLKFFILE